MHPVYGPKETAKKQYANMVSQFLWEMRAGRRPIVFGDGSQTRDFTYVKDVVRALMLAMASDYHGKVIDMINARQSPAVEPIYRENPIKNYVKDTLADTSRCRQILGFEAEIGLEEGIGRIDNCYTSPAR